MLTKAQTEAVQDMADRFVKAEPQFTEQQLNVLKGIIETPPDYSDVVPKLENATVNNNNTMNAPVTIGDVNIHMDGSGVVDPDSFCYTFRRSTKMQKAIQDATIAQIRKPYTNSLIL